MKTLSLLLILFSVSAAAETGLDCSSRENHLVDIIDVREFDCETSDNCAVGIWAPKELERALFLAFNLVLNVTGSDEYDLALPIKEQSIDDEVAVFIYGTLQALESTTITVSYSRKGAGCPIQSTTQLKHNKSSKKDAVNRASS